MTSAKTTSSIHRNDWTWNDLIAEVWFTDEIRTERPTPQDEAKWGYAVIEHSLWKAIPQLWKRLSKLTFKVTGETLPLSDIAPVKISSWMGGDRDGNPNVTAYVTKDDLKAGQVDGGRFIFKRR